MVNIPTEIKKWAKTRPFWERLALDKIISGKQFTKSDYDELFQFLLEENDLSDVKGQRPKLDFFDAIAELEPAEREHIRLVQVSNMKNVNALAPGQTLTFGTELTAIFGNNASGKSGYARVLGCAGFTRGDKKIYPDITKPTSKDPMTADIDVSRGGDIETIKYEIGSQCPALSSFSIFDNASVGTHLTRSNTYHFSPAGLSYLTRLAEVTGKVKERLDAHIKDRGRQKDISHLFPGKSKVRDLVSNINPEKTLEELKELARMKPEEKQRIGDLEFKTAELKVQKASERIAILAQKIVDLEDLNDRLLGLEMKINDDVVENIRSSIRSYCEHESKTREHSLERFESSHFTQTGTKQWHRFAEAARALAEAEQANRDLYPQPSDHCLLCRQPLSQDAHQLLTDLWDFLDSKAELSMKEAQQVLANTKEELSSIVFDFFNSHSVSYRHLEEHDEKLIPIVEGFIQACEERCLSLVEMASSLEHKDVLGISETPRAEIRKLVRKLKEERRILQEENIPEKMDRLEQELVELRHREALKKHYPEIRKEVEKRIWIKKAKGIHLSTRTITMKYDQLFKEVVTEQYISQFQEILQGLGCLLHVKIETTSKKSMAHKELVLEKDPRARAYDATPENILSGGEQHAVAFADFLTEVRLDDKNNGIIMDDPVTSLDLEWKRDIATMLVKESKNRQVIIFTHDLPFLYDLDRISRVNSIDIKTHWIRRGGDNVPGYIYLDESPAKEEKYKSVHGALEHYKRAIGASPAEQENHLYLGFDALRRSYEAFIIFDVLQKVVKRFGPEVSPGRLKDIVWDEKIINEIIENYENISRHIGAHLHVDEFPKPSCKQLIREIEKYDALRKEIKDLRKGKKS